MIRILALTDRTAARFLDREGRDAAAARVAGRIVRDVRRRGGAAVRAWSRRLDGPGRGSLRVGALELRRAARDADPRFVRQLRRDRKSVV